VEVALPTYRQLQSAARAEDQVLTKVLKGLSCRDYESCAANVPEAFGLSASSISRQFQRASVKKLRELCERDLSAYDIVAVFLDGKTFGADEIVIALGVTIQGEKVILGFVQTATENEAVLTEFLKGLLDRGLRIDQGLLAVIDGSKGMRKAIQNAFGNRSLTQRCQWHKRENVVKYLAKSQQATFRRKMQQAYSQPTYDKAKKALQAVRAQLAILNQSSVASLDEGLEETLTLHRLGLFMELGRSFKTTNCIENLQALVGHRTDKVDHWKNSDQKHRWLAASLLEIEPRLRTVCGRQHLKRLRTALQQELKGCLKEVKVA
jgi:transposase-like protein